MRSIHIRPILILAGALLIFISSFTVISEMHPYQNILPRAGSTPAPPSQEITAIPSPLPVNPLSGKNPSKDNPANSNLPPISSTMPATGSAPSATALPPADSAPITSGYHMVFVENFDGTTLNPNVWNTQYRWGNSNPPELEQYQPDAIQVKNGLLTLKANPNILQGLPYESGMIASYDRFYFEYGYAEARVKIPRGKGLWSAFWMLAQDPKSSSEIDAMEVLGDKPDTVYLTTHFGSPQGDKIAVSNSFRGTDFSLDFHTFAIDWKWDKITWFIDGQQVFQILDNIPHEPMYLVANLAVGGDWPGIPDQTTSFPAYMQIDYIRVYAP